MSNVYAGKPKATGAVYVAPIGTTLPTDATSELTSAYVSLGYVSEDGITNTPTIESTDVKDWGGNTVASLLTSKEDKFKFKLIESSLDVLKTIYGSSNVTGTFAAGATVKSTADEPANNVWVFETLTDDGVRRIVLPIAKISELGDIVFNRTEVIGYEVTLTAMPDSSAVTHYEYIKTNA